MRQGGISLVLQVSSVSLWRPANWIWDWATRDPGIGVRGRLPLPTKAGWRDVRLSAGNIQEFLVGGTLLPITSRSVVVICHLPRRCSQPLPFVLTLRRWQTQFIRPVRGAVFSDQSPEHFPFVHVLAVYVLIVCSYAHRIPPWAFNTTNPRLLSSGQAPSPKFSCSVAPIVHCMWHTFAVTREDKRSRSLHTLLSGPSCTSDLGR